LDAETVQQVRSLLAQGYRIGTEHADQRRFRTSSWKSCSPIDSQQESQVLAALQTCLSEHQGEYVRLIGIDTKAKRRILETIIQRPNGSATTNGSAPASFSPAPVSAAAPSPNYGSNGSGSLDRETIDQVRSLLSQRYRIGVEHADARRFKTSSWQSCPPIQGQQEAQVLAELKSCLATYQGEYVRLIGVDPQAKRRVLEAVIQRP
jgi:carbon dioxide concentrating mechanism protein CcmM